MAAHDESKIHSLIAQWEMDQASGRRITPEELCKDTPELLEEFRKKLGQLHQFPASDETSPFDDKPTERDGIASTPATLPTIPNYRIEGILGRGGMGVVYKAVQLPLNRTVALKMILSGEHASSDERLRFLAEAEAIAKLQHPGIVQVYDFNTHGNHPFFAMEYLTGGSLDKKLSGTPMVPKEAVELVQKLAEAVQAAHEQGIVHRDLKPGNILLTSSGLPKITDFGLAKTGGSNLTITGKPLGTPSYMSPEQAEGKKEVGPASDIYALGAILYECLSGRPPFRAATPLDTVLQVIKEEPVSIRHLQPNIPVDIDTICHKCLEKDAAKRYGSAMMLGEDLARYLRGETILARPVGRIHKAWKWCRRHPAIAGMGLAIAAIMIIATTVASILALWALENQDKANANAQYATEQTANAIAQQKKAEDENRASRRLLGISRVERGLSEWRISDNQAAMLWFGEQSVADAENDRALTATRYRVANYRRHSEMPILMHASIFKDRVAYATFSADSQKIIVPSPVPTVMDSSSGNIIKTLEHKDFGSSYVVNSRDGKLFAVCCFDKVYVYDSATCKLISNPIPCKFGVNHADFCNNDRFLLVVSYDVMIWDIVSQKAVFEPIECKGKTSCATLSLDRKLLLTCDINGIVRIWDINSLKQVNQPIKTPVYSKAIISPDNKFVLTIDRDALQLWSLSTGQKVGSKMQHESPISRVLFHPDGTIIYSACDDGTIILGDVLTGKQVTAPLQHAKWVTTLDVSRDGRFLVSGSGDGSVCVRNAKSGKPALPLLWHPHSVNHVSFSTDGSRILSTCGDFISKRGEVCVWSIQTDSRRNNDEPKNYELIALSTDTKSSAGVQGSYIGNSAINKLSNIVVNGLNTKNIIRYNGWVNHMSFSPDSQAIITSHGMHGKPGEACIWKLSDGSKATTFPHKSRVNHSCFSADGKHIVAACEDGTVSIWDLATGHEMPSPALHYRNVLHASFSACSRYVITASGKTPSKGRIIGPEQVVRFDDRNKPRSQIWDVSTGKAVVHLGSTTDEEGYCFADFSHNSKLAVTCSVRKHAQLWHVMTGKTATPPLLHQGEVCHAEFSPDDKLIVTASGDRTARIWSTSTGFQTVPPLQHQDYVIAARFSHDGHCIATASVDKTARLWDVHTGQPISPPLIHDDVVLTIAFSPDNKYLLTGTRQGEKRWDISPDTRPIKDLVHSVQYQAVSKLDQVGTRIPLEHDSELNDKFPDFRSKYPADFTFTYQQRSNWRLKQIANCCNERNLPAALFHQNWLLAEAVLESAKNKASSK